VVVFARNDDGPVIGKRDIVALVVFHGAFQRSHQLSTRTEHRQIEVVMVVCNDHLAVRTHANADRVISHTLTTDDSQWSAVVREHLQSKQKPRSTLHTSSAYEHNVICMYLVEMHIYRMLLLYN